MGTEAIAIKNLNETLKTLDVGKTKREKPYDYIKNTDIYLHNEK